MTPKAQAQQWAKANPEFSGILEIVTETARGKGGRLGSKETRYRYLVDAGQIAKQGATGEADNRTFNGICDVTGRVYLAKVLRWHHDDRGNFISTEETAAAVGAYVDYKFMAPGHPIHNKGGQARNAAIAIPLED